MILRDRRAGMVLGAPRRVAGMARMRAGKRDQAGEDCAEQRQEDDRLIHAFPINLS